MPHPLPEAEDLATPLRGLGSGGREEAALAAAFAFGQAPPDAVVDPGFHRVGEALLLDGAGAADPLGLLVLEGADREEEIRVGGSAQASGAPILVLNDELQGAPSRRCAPRR